MTAKSTTQLCSQKARKGRNKKYKKTRLMQQKKTESRNTKSPTHNITSWLVMRCLIDYIVSCDSANRQKQHKEPSCKRKPIFWWTFVQMKTQWQNNWSMYKNSVVVSHKIGEGPQRSSSQPTPFITFWQVLKKTVGNKISRVRKTNIKTQNTVK